MSTKGRRRLIATMTVAGVVATLWSLRARLLARSEEEFRRSYDR